MTVIPIAPHDVHASLNYYKPEGDEPPFTYTSATPEGKPKSNIGQDAKPAVIHDLRGKEGTASLDTTGFQFIKHTSSENVFLDEDVIKTKYYGEVEELLKKVTGAKRVYIFDHTIRRNYSNAQPDETIRGPVERVHVDQTYEAGVNRVRRHLPEDAERLLQARVRIINVWRPIENPVAHHPLAVADWRTLDVENDLVPARLIYPDREGSVFVVKYNPQHKWCFLSDQTPDEVTLIKCYDSAKDVARLTPHSAFRDASSPKDASPRQSIEIRALVFDIE